MTCNILQLTRSGKVDEAIMLAYYQRLFPFRTFFQWLNHSPVPTANFTNREIAFTLSNDAYLRYQSFDSAEAFKREVVRLNPSRFEIGPVYSVNPRDSRIFRRTAFKPLYKELVFDIDLTDYDDIRTCCTDKSICDKCWRFITIAVQVLDVAFREDFGFQHILWVYSGRRGIHAWVCDKRASQLDDAKRRAVASYLGNIAGSNGKKVMIRRPLHPHIARSLNLIKGHFVQDILVDQDPWSTVEGAERLLSQIPDKQLVAALRQKWSQYQYRPSKDKWKDIDDLAQEGVSKTLDTKRIKNAKQDIILECMYPRLDIEVSRHLNHLLKSPFCIHPATARVCVPVDPSNIEEFSFSKVPTVYQLLDEISEYDDKHRQSVSAGETAERIADYEKTSLAPYMKVFKSLAADLNNEEIHQKRTREEGLDF